MGIIGFPNAGKSSLIAKISAARPKIAPYPFTTLTPNLGVVRVEEFKEFVVVDIPGLIEGAHEGRGLGDRFLKHVERTRLLIHLIDLSPTGRDPLSDYEVINRELRSFSPALAEKPQIVVGNKSDLLSEEQRREVRARFAAHSIDIQLISALTGEGTRELVYRCYRRLEELKAAEFRVQSPAEIPVRRVYMFTGGPAFEVHRDGEVFVLSGPSVERLSRLSLEERDAQEYLYERLEALGILAELRRQGLQPGQTIRLGKHELVYQEAESAGAA